MMGEQLFRPWSYVELSNGGFALVDDADLCLVADRSWRHTRDGRSIYVVSSKPPKSAVHTSRLMHRVILDAPSNRLVDHINGNGLDNRCSNLRLATRAQNSQNRQVHANGSPPFRGVTLHRQTGKWQAQLKTSGRSLYLGLFATPEAAARAYDSAARENFGEFSSLNFPEADR